MCVEHRPGVADELVLDSGDADELVVDGLDAGAVRQVDVVEHEVQDILVFVCLGSESGEHGAAHLCVGLIATFLDGLERSLQVVGRRRQSPLEMRLLAVEQCQARIGDAGDRSVVHHVSVV